MPRNWHAPGRPKQSFGQITTAPGSLTVTVRLPGSEQGAIEFGTDERRVVDEPPNNEDELPNIETAMRISHEPHSVPLIHGVGGQCVGLSQLRSRLVRWGLSLKSRSNHPNVSAEEKLVTVVALKYSCHQVEIWHF